MATDMSFKDNLESFSEALCEVKAQNGDTLLLGKISTINTKYSLSFNVVSGDGTELMEIRYETPITAVLKKQERFLVVSGEIALANKMFWRISHLKLVQDTEKRTFFRVRADSPCKVSDYTEISEDDANDDFFEAPEVPEYDAKIIDLSLSGIKLRSDHEFERSDHIVLSNLRFKYIKSFKLKCRIVHKAVYDRAGKREFIYGCEFLDVNQYTTDLICRDIFDVQRTQLKQKVI